MTFDDGQARFDDKVIAVPFDDKAGGSQSPASSSSAHQWVKETTYYGSITKTSETGTCKVNAFRRGGSRRCGS